MNDFTASNEMRIDASNPNAVVILDDSGDNTLQGYNALDENDMQALREFFQAEADERFGRWRWPENPDYVVYPKEDGLFEVLHETTGLVLTSTVTGNAPFSDEHAQAARAYLAAHPEPKPWHDANAGEVWLLTVDREIDVPAVASSSGGGHIVFTAATGGAGGTEELPPSTRYITAGRRIWPEVPS